MAVLGEQTALASRIWSGLEAFSLLLLELQHVVHVVVVVVVVFFHIVIICCHAAVGSRGEILQLRQKLAVVDPSFPVDAPHMQG